MGEAYDIFTANSKEFLLAYKKFKPKLEIMSKKEYTTLSFLQARSEYAKYVIAMNERLKDKLFKMLEFLDSKSYKGITKYFIGWGSYWELIAILRETLGKPKIDFHEPGISVKAYKIKNLKFEKLAKGIMRAQIKNTDKDIFLQHIKKIDSDAKKTKHDLIIIRQQ